MIGSSVASLPANSSVTRPWRETSIRFERCRISGRYKEITHNRKPFVGDAVDELVDFGDSADIDAAGRFVKDDELLFNPISWKTNDPRTLAGDGGERAIRESGTRCISARLARRCAPNNERCPCWDRRG